MSVNRNLILKVLQISLDPKIKSFVHAQFQKCEITDIKSSEQFMDNLDKWKEDDFDLILCGIGWNELPVTELAQSLNNVFKFKNIFFIGLDSQFQENKSLIKNGFTDYFYFPMDRTLLSITLHQAEKFILGTSYEQFIPIGISNIKLAEKLDFELNLFLPANNRYIKINNAGAIVDSSLAKRIESSMVGQLFIKESDLTLYHKFLSSRLKGLKPASNDIKKSVRTLFQELLSPRNSVFDDGKKFMNFANQLMLECINSPDLFNLQKELLSSLGNHSDGLYERSQKIATIGGLIALATGRAKPEDVVIAALFCDLGLAQIPENILEKEFKDLSEEETNIYFLHVHKSLNILGSKKIVLLPYVREAISDHHEKFDGKGYPNQKPGFKLSELTQILSFSIQFEELTRIIPNKARVYPHKAVLEISKNGSINPDIIFDIKQLFAEFDLIDNKNNKAG